MAAYFTAQKPVSIDIPAYIWHVRLSNASPYSGTVRNSCMQSAFRLDYGSSNQAIPLSLARLGRKSCTHQP
jgi:hypothetical protein